MARILLIEDEADLRAILAEGLGLAGFDVIEAGDGDAGYAAILVQPPDLVLCDISMPGLRGDHLLLRLRREHPGLGRLPFLFLTALADRDSVLAGQKLGADDYITKPVDLELLVGRIDQRLAQVQRWEAGYGDDVARTRQEFLLALSDRSRLSFLSAADVLNRLSDAVVLFNGQDRAIFANRMALRLLEQGDGLALADGRFVTMTAEDTRWLQEAIAAIRGNGSGEVSLHLNLDRPSGRRPYAVRVCRLEAGLAVDPDFGALAAVFLADPDTRARLSEASLSDRYGLTQTEARIVADIALGHSVDQIAALNAISRNTIHHHLKGIFSKTGTARQSELVALVLSCSAVEAVPAGLRVN
jgi:DNA-binding response OmpR family regulator/DNA-binding CsgD family transcriptional regulator